MEGWMPDIGITQSEPVKVEMNEPNSVQPVSADSAASGEVARTAAAQTVREGPARAIPEDALILLPVRNVVMFPGLILPIMIDRARSRAAAQEAARSQRPVGILLQKKPDTEEPGPDDLHWVGTTANVLRYVTAPDDHKPVGLPTTWSETENVRWKTPIPLKGWSTPVVMEGKIWLTTATLDKPIRYSIVW